MHDTDANTARDTFLEPIERPDELSVLSFPAAPEARHDPAAPEDPHDFLAFYGFADNPFADSVNTRYFYKTSGHEEACIRMMLAVRNSMSLALITGPSGTGKSLISQMVLTQLDPAKVVPVLVLVSPGMTKTVLMKEILAELGLEIPQDRMTTTHDLLKILTDHVIHLHEDGKSLVVLVDECHFLSSESLHMIRTLTNVELPDRKLVTILLFGEQRFVKRLDHPSHESLRSRIYLRSELTPLTQLECAEYVKFRLMTAGRLDDLFTAAALAAIHAASGGICRVINKVATLALIEGCLQRIEPIDDAIVARATRMM